MELRRAWLGFSGPVVTILWYEFNNNHNCGAQQRPLVMADAGDSTTAHLRAIPFR